MLHHGSLLLLDGGRPFLPPFVFYDPAGGEESEGYTASGGRCRGRLDRNGASHLPGMKRGGRNAPSSISGF